MEFRAKGPVVLILEIDGKEQKFPLKRPSIDQQRAYDQEAQAMKADKDKPDFDNGKYFDLMKGYLIGCGVPKDHAGNIEIDLAGELIAELSGAKKNKSPSPT
jgi:hypothetical protein